MARNSCRWTVRDSTYVLDEICNNEPELPIGSIHGYAAAPPDESSLPSSISSASLPPGCAISVTAASLPQAD